MFSDSEGQFEKWRFVMVEHGARIALVLSLLFFSAGPFQYSSNPKIQSPFTHAAESVQNKSRVGESLGERSSPEGNRTGWNSTRWNSTGGNSTGWRGLDIFDSMYVLKARFDPCHPIQDTKTMQTTTLRHPMQTTTKTTTTMTTTTTKTTQNTTSTQPP